MPADTQEWLTEYKTWTPTENALPDEGVVVETKIHDGRGIRNEQTLKRKGRLWFYPDGSMYVYTHWRSPCPTLTT